MEVNIGNVSEQEGDVRLRAGRHVHLGEAQEVERVGKLVDRDVLS